MPKPKRGPTPDFRVSDETKMGLVSSIVPLLMTGLNSDGEGSTGDDVVDTIALMAAVMIEADTWLTTPGHFREAAEAFATHVRRRTNQLVAEREVRRGVSMLDAIMAAAEDRQAAGGKPH